MLLTFKANVSEAMHLLLMINLIGKKNKTVKALIYLYMEKNVIQK
jgi:hypothetical protein